MTHIARVQNELAQLRSQVEPLAVRKRSLDAVLERRRKERTLAEGASARARHTRLIERTEAQRNELQGELGPIRSRIAALERATQLAAERDALDAPRRARIAERGKALEQCARDATDALATLQHALGELEAHASTIRSDSLLPRDAHSPLAIEHLRGTIEEVVVQALGRHFLRNTGYERPPRHSLLSLCRRWPLYAGQGEP